MAEQAIKAELRDPKKSGVVQGLRRQGRIPAVVYGHDFETIPFSVDGKELVRAIRSGGINALMELQLAGYRGKGPLLVMIKDFQTDVVSHKLTHIDFLKLDMKEKVSVKVTVKLVGKAIGLEQGGLVEQSTRELEVKCLPGNIPDSIEVDISGLNLGDSLHVTDLKLPEGVEVPREANITIVSIVAPKEEKVEEAAAPVAGTPEAAAAAGVTAEGGAAPAAAGGETKEEKKEPKEKKEAKK
ncbi:MAG: 50S ribosomal protein L25 [Deltaproteobacteria bacterium]|nr:50S ribosomal protein L25 [Deltaproteobacteria bacterium]MBI4374222.1 50S ribosomal protein L25 [Deltaproteobacteria bacterium]